VGLFRPQGLEPAFSHYAFMDADPGAPGRASGQRRVQLPPAGRRRRGHFARGVLHTNEARRVEGQGLPAQHRCREPGGAGVERPQSMLKIEDTPYGFHYVALRKTDAAGPGTRAWCRSSCPMAASPALAFQFTVLEVPTDDTRTSTYLIVHGNAPISEEKILELLGLDNADYYDRKTGNFLGNWSNSFGQSRERMLDSWTGLRGVESRTRRSLFRKVRCTTGPRSIWSRRTRP